MADVNGFSVFDFPGTFSESTTMPHAFAGQQSTLRRAPVPLRVVDAVVDFEVPAEASSGISGHEHSLSLESLVLLKQGLTDAAYGLIEPIPASVLLEDDDAE